MLNPERFFEARDEHGDTIGFYYFEERPPDLDYGLGLRPDLTGQGLGLEFFLAGLAFAHERYRPERVRLHVAAFNERARRVYERAGLPHRLRTRAHLRALRQGAVRDDGRRASLDQLVISVRQLEPGEVEAVDRTLPLSRLRQPAEAARRI